MKVGTALNIQVGKLASQDWRMQNCHYGVGVTEGPTPAGSG